MQLQMFFLGWTSSLFLLLLLLLNSAQKLKNMSKTTTRQMLLHFLIPSVVGDKREKYWDGGEDVVQDVQI